ncbi:MAG: 50S ribosomal protein L4 [Candidatus Shikimatogenerans sp. JK-2022]|nr:50S ribosomal protein L4 [Candidatus Shikimatogenerans bostrichidophilus]
MGKITNLIKKNIKLFKKYNNNKNNHIVYLYIKSYLNSQRKGNSKTKERSEIKGSTRKILKQKGTGNARKGDIKNPIFRGGGRIFGPKKRNYKIKINKTIKNKVYKILISQKILNNNVYFFKKNEYNSYKTKDLISFLKNKKININNKKKRILILTDKIYKNLLISSKNIKNILINYKNNINYFNILISDYIILIGENLDKYLIKKIFKNKI